jgi:hypothetical protein
MYFMLQNIYIKLSDFENHLHIISPNKQASTKALLTILRTHSILLSPQLDFNALPETANSVTAGKEMFSRRRESHSRPDMTGQFQHANGDLQRRLTAQPKTTFTIIVLIDASVSAIFQAHSYKCHTIYG